METSAEYLASVNSSVLVMVQIETKEAVDNLDEIAQVEGVGESNLQPVGDIKPIIDVTQTSCLSAHTISQFHWDIQSLTPIPTHTLKG